MIKIAVDRFPDIIIPGLLFTEPSLRAMSTNAKLLYGMLLFRSENTRKDHVIFRAEEIGTLLNCSPGTVTRILAELDSKTGVGLIERTRVGLNQPDRIYVRRL